jgi:hypothetical protein
MTNTSSAVERGVIFNHAPTLSRGMGLFYSWLKNRFPLSEIQLTVLNLRRPVFSHGQFYSAMTRVPDADNVLILKYEGDSSQRTPNIV